MLLAPPEKVKEENYRFFNITQVAYIFGALGHLALGFYFWWVKVYPMVWFNAALSVPVFLFSFFINRQGRHNIAFSLACFELLTHQIAGVYYIGWDSGLQYYLVYLGALSFFNASWKREVRLSIIMVVCFSFLVLYLFFKVPEDYILTNAQYDILYLGSSVAVILLIALLLNYYVQASNRMENELLENENQLKEERDNLQEALAEIKTLSGLLPICSKCKKIRDDKGYWNQIETYIKKHSQAEFSHGICPECSDELYGNKDWYKKMKKKRGMK